MNAPLGRTDLGKCECHECTRDAVRLVTVEAGDDWKPSETPTRSWQIALCEPCAQHHERASHTERTTEKGGRE